jgi:hypothetical protein
METVRLIGWFMVFNATFNNISVMLSVLFGGGNQSTWRKHLTYRKLLPNFIM